MESAFTIIFPRIESLGVVFYWMIFLIGVIESLPFVSIIIPSGLILIAAGFIASEGAYHPTDLIWAATLGCVIGDSVGYYLGRSNGRSFFAGRRFFIPRYFARADVFFEKRGVISIILGRFIGPLRPFVAFVAGMHRMRYATFISANIVSAAAWVTLYVLIGFYFGEQGKTIGLWIGRSTYIILALAVFLAVGIYFFAQRRKLADSDGSY